MHDWRDSVTKAGWTWSLFQLVAAKDKLVFGEHTAVQPLLLPTKTECDGMWGKQGCLGRGALLTCSEEHCHHDAPG